MKTFFKTSKCNPDRHAPNIQNKQLLLTCPIGTYIFVSAATVGIPICYTKNYKTPDWCIFQDYQQYDGLCSHISSFPKAPELDH